MVKGPAVQAGGRPGGACPGGRRSEPIDSVRSRL